MDFTSSLLSQWQPHVDELLVWGVAGVCAALCVVALVNVLEMLFDSEST